MSKDAPSKRAGGVVHQAQPDERVQYNAPRLTCYGTLTELTRAQGNDPPTGDIAPPFNTGYAFTQ